MRTTREREREREQGRQCSALGFWPFVEMGFIKKTKRCLYNKVKGPKTFNYVPKIVTVWTVPGTEQVLNRCQVVKSKIEVINHCLINLICIFFLRL